MLFCFDFTAFFPFLYRLSICCVYAFSFRSHSINITCNIQQSASNELNVRVLDKWINIYQANKYKVLSSTLFCSVCRCLFIAFFSRLFSFYFICPQNNCEPRCQRHTHLQLSIICWCIISTQSMCIEIKRKTWNENSQQPVNSSISRLTSDRCVNPKNFCVSAQLVLVCMQLSRYNWILCVGRMLHDSGTGWETELRFDIKGFCVLTKGWHTHTHSFSLFAHLLPDIEHNKWPCVRLFSLVIVSDNVNITSLETKTDKKDKTYSRAGAGKSARHRNGQHFEMEDKW